MFLIGSELRNKSLKFIYLIFLFYVPHEALAEKTKKKPPENISSLFFPPEETKMLDAYENKGNKGGSEASSSLGTIKLGAIYLGSLFFQNPDKWTLWVNGRRIMSHEDVHHKLPQGLKIEEVSESQVLFSLAVTPGSPPQSIILHPNQTYLVDAQEIWEGDLRPED